MKKNSYIVYIAMGIVLCFISGSDLLAQKNIFTGYSLAGVDYTYGRTNDPNKKYKSLILHPAQGISLSLYKSRESQNDWKHTWPKTREGYIFYYSSIGNKDKLGSYLSVARFIDFGFIERSTFRLALRSGLGAAFVTRTFHPTENYQNMLIGTHLNFFIHTVLKADYQPPSLKGIGFNAGVGNNHISNGNFKIPNVGVDNVFLFGGITYNTDRSEGERKTEKPATNKRWDLSVFPTVGVSEEWRYGENKNLVLTLTSDLMYSLSRKLMIGGGTALFYDHTHMMYSNHNTEPVEMHGEAIDAGIHIAFLVNISRLQLVLREGYPVYSGGDRYGERYNIFGMKYHVSENFHVCLYHKSHNGFNGDNVQVGIGYNIIHGHRNY